MLATTVEPNPDPASRPQDGQPPQSFHHNTLAHKTAGGEQDFHLTCITAGVERKSGHMAPRLCMNAL